MLAFEIKPLLVPHEEQTWRLGELWGDEQAHLSRLNEIRRRRNKSVRVQNEEKLAYLS